jgi:hypothetical protein
MAAGPTAARGYAVCTPNEWLRLPAVACQESLQASGAGHWQCWSRRMIVARWQKFTHPCDPASAATPACAVIAAEHKHQGRLVARGRHNLLLLAPAITAVVKVLLTCHSASKSPAIPDPV